MYHKNEVVESILERLPDDLHKSVYSLIPYPYVAHMNVCVYNKCFNLCQYFLFLYDKPSEAGL